MIIASYTLTESANPRGKNSFFFNMLINFYLSVSNVIEVIESIITTEVLYFINKYIFDKV